MIPVLLTTYNTAKYIRNAIDSMLRYFEYIILEGRLKKNNLSIIILNFQHFITEKRFIYYD